MAKGIDQRSFELALRVVTLRTDDEYRRAACWTIVGQLIRASTSVGANLAEASVAQTKRDLAELRSEAASVGNVVSTIVRRANASESRGRD